MRVTVGGVPGVLVIEPDVFQDHRGFFLETYNLTKYTAAGIDTTFVQDNHSKSSGGTLRGLHLQVLRPQSKLVRVVSGAIFDVAVDVRRGSPTFGKWAAVTLSAAQFNQCFVPAGFAHGFVALTPEAQVEYKCSDVYDPASEIGIAWNDPQLAIAWPVETPLLSARDRAHPTLTGQMDRLPVYTAPD